MRRGFWRLIEALDDLNHRLGFGVTPICELHDMHLIGWDDWQYNRRLTKGRKP